MLSFLESSLLARQCSPVAIPVMLIYIGRQFFNTGQRVTGVYIYVAVIITTFVSISLFMLPIIAIALSYFSFTEAKDEGTLYQRIMMIGKSSTDTIEPLTEEY